MSKSRCLLFLLWLTTLFLSACRIVVTTDINEDGSGEWGTEVVYTTEEVTAFKQQPGNGSRSICDQINDNLPPDVDATFIEETRRDETYCVSKRPFADLGELRLSYALMEDVTVNQLEMKDSQFIFDVMVDAPATGPNGQPPVPTEWHVTVPGTLGDHNADWVEGQTLVWTLTPGEKNNLRVESSLGFLASRTVVLVGTAVLLCLCLLASVSGLMAFRALRRRNIPAPSSL